MTDDFRGMLGQMSLDNTCIRCSAPVPVDWPYAYCRGCINESVLADLRTEGSK